MTAPFRRTRSHHETASPAPSPLSASVSSPLSSSSRSNSWSAFRKKNVEPDAQQQPETPPTPPSPTAESPASSASSIDTVTPPRVLSTLASLASPSTYYKPAARFFRPSSSSGSSSRPSSASSYKPSSLASFQAPSQSADMSSNPRSKEELDRHASQLILNAVIRAKSSRELTRTDSINSNSSQSRPSEPTPTDSPQIQTTAPLHPHLVHSATAPGTLTSTPSSTPSRSSWFGFSWDKEKYKEDKAAKDDKRGRSLKNRPSSEIFSSAPVPVPTGGPTSFNHGGGIGGIGGFKAPSIKGGRPNSMPLAPSPQVAAALRSLGSPVVPTIREGVPLTESWTIDSTMTSASEDLRGRAVFRDRARSSSPFRAFRTSRSRHKDKDKRAKSAGGRSPSPAISALKCSQSDVESDAESLGTGMRRRKKASRVRRSAFDQGDKDDDDDEADDQDDDDDDDSWSEDEGDEEEDDDDGFDPLTTQNTEANAAPVDPEAITTDGLVFPGYDDDIELPDPLGEGVNVVRPEEPLFARSLMASHRPTSPPARSTTRPTASLSPPKSTPLKDDTDKAETGSSSSVPISLTMEPITMPNASSKPASTATASSPTSSSSVPLTPAAVAARTPKRKKTTRSTLTHHDPLPLVVSRPHFARDRCTVIVRHGDPDGDRVSTYSGVMNELGVIGANCVGKREPKRYLVFSDLSEESRWAVEWGIGTVLRDGDEMIIVTVQETDNKLDPVDGNSVDRLQKLRNQQERQALASLLVRQATALLQRTKLNVTVTCQALHAKSARRLFLDIIDFIEPTMVIVGSRGLGKLKGILLGSTSHYLIQKSSVPVMVARRRLKRPTKKSHTAAQAIALRSEKRVSLADARIEKVSSGKGKGATGVDKEDLQKEDEAAEKQWPSIPGEDEDEVIQEEDEEEDEEGAPGASVKVAGV